MTVAEPGLPDFQWGLTRGLATGLALGVPAGLALKVSGYPSTGLHAWWVVLAVALTLTLVASAALAVRRGALARGIAVGVTLGIAVAPLFVVVDIVLGSA